MTEVKQEKSTVTEVKQKDWQKWNKKRAVRAPWQKWNKSMTEVKQEKSTVTEVKQKDWQNWNSILKTDDV